MSQVTPFKTTTQMSGTSKQIMHLLGANSEQIQKSSNTDAFHTSQDVHCVPAAFRIDFQKLKYPPFSRCSPCVPSPRLVPDELETLDSTNYRGDAKGRCHSTSSPGLCCMKNTALGLSLRSESPRTDSETQGEKYIVTRVIIYSSITRVLLFNISCQ